jgi:hypothetical protein
MNIVLWVLQVVLSAAFFAHGWVRNEMSSAAITLVLLAMATFVAFMRHRVVPIGARQSA